MKKNAQRVLEILNENYISLYRGKVYNEIVEIKEPIHYKVKTPKAVKVTFHCKNDDITFIKPCIEEIVDGYWEDIYPFKEVIVSSTEPTVMNNSKITVLLVI